VFSSSGLKRLHREELGGAYTLSYVMVIPMFMLLTCVIVETTLMLCAKVGTTYAAYSGARTALVWASADDRWSTTEDRIENAATKSFVPFASAMGAKGSAPSQSEDYIRAYKSFANDPISDRSIESKFANAADRLKVTTSGRPATHDSDIEVTVEYQFRFNMPGIGKLLGEAGSDGDYFFPLRSTATLQNEGPKNSRQELGIGYGKLD
jgi:Flp pilus assembly protein TadG